MLPKELCLVFTIQKAFPGPRDMGSWCSLPLFAMLTLVTALLQSSPGHLLTHEN